MKTQKYNHITRVLVAVGLFSMVIPALAAQVPPGTALAEKQELVRNNGSEPSSLDPHKVESDVENNIISDLLKGWSAYRQQERLSPGWRRSGRIRTTPSGRSTCVPG
jgi:ABC-type oligopeptide transport system substrate-binding subunit